MKRELVIASLLTVVGWAWVAGFAEAEVERPNILFCISDDQSWPHASAYGTEWVQTPGFDRVAREGILFNNCYTPNPKCSPSRACILTGRNSWQLEDAANHMPFFPVKFKTWMEALKESGGYTTGHTAKGWAPGVAEYEDGTRRELTGKAWNEARAKPPAGSISSIDYAGNFEAFLEAAPEGEPWAFWYGATEPHRGYEYGAGALKGGKRVDEIDEVPGFWPDNETVRNDMLDYAFEIEHFDGHLERMLTLLEERGELDNTLIIVTSDNGMPFPRVKGQIYEMSHHLPLAIRWGEGIEKPGRVVDGHVNFIDFAPTFLEVAGLAEEAAKMEPITGESLTGIFRGEWEGREVTVTGKERHDTGRPNDECYPVRAIVRDGYLYVRNFKTDRWPAGNPETGYLNTDGSPTKTEVLELRRSGEDASYWEACFGKRGEEALYRIADDPECLVDLAGNPEYGALKKAMEEEMLGILEAQKDPRILGDEEYFEAIPVATDSARFYERWEAGEKVKAGWVNPGDFEEEEIEEKAVKETKD